VVAEVAANQKFQGFSSVMVYGRGLNGCCDQAHLKALHEGGEITPEEIVEAHGEGIANIEKSVRPELCVRWVGACVTSGVSTASPKVWRYPS
jgi:hypothetical protein